MSEDPKERVNRIRAKIDELSKINPNTYLSDRQLDKINQKLQEKRKGVIAITSLDHHRRIFESDPTKTTFPLMKNAKDTGTIVANYFKKIELRKQQSANNESIKKQKENSNTDVKQVNVNKSQINIPHNCIQLSTRDNQRKKGKQIIPIQIKFENNKQMNIVTPATNQKSPVHTLGHKQKNIEAVVVIDPGNEDNKLSFTQKINPKQPINKPQENNDQVIDIDRQIPKSRVNLFKEDFSKNPLKNPFKLSQQKKIEIQFEKNKSKIGEQNIFLQDNQSNIVKRSEQIQPRFQPIKRICSQPAPISSATNKINGTDSIFAKSVNGINLQPAKNQQITQISKRVNQSKANVSIRQQKNIFNNKVSPMMKNIGMQKPLSSISESNSELQSAKEDSALKVTRQKKVPVFQGIGSNKPFSKNTIIQQQKSNYHQVQFQSFGAKNSNQIKKICQIQDDVKVIPKLQSKQPQKLNIFLSTNRTENDKANPFINNNKGNQADKNITTSFLAPAPNIFTNLVNKSNNIFSQPLPASRSNQAAENIFTKMTASDNIFGKPTILNIKKNTENEAHEDNQDNNSESSNDPIQAQDNADPNLSTIKYDYLQPALIFKQPAIKFRCGCEQKGLQQNLIISLEKLPNSEDIFLIARMANKLISFNGKLLKNISKIRSLNGSPKNVEITKILQMMPNTNGLALIKIQFKDPEVGERFITQVEKIIS